MSCYTLLLYALTSLLTSGPLTAPPSWPILAYALPLLSSSVKRRAPVASHLNINISVKLNFADQAQARQSMRAMDVCNSGETLCKTLPHLASRYLRLAGYSLNKHPDSPT